MCVFIYFFYLHIDSAWGDEAKKGDLKGEITWGIDERLVFELLADDNLLFVNVIVVGGVTAVVVCERCWISLGNWVAVSYKCRVLLENSQMI